MDLFRDIINGILSNNRTIFEDPDAERAYVPFIVNRALSYHQDTLFLANQANQLPHLDKKPQIDLFLNSVKGHKRPWSKWSKPIKSSDLDAVKKCYGYSNAKALQALKLLTPEQLASIIKEQQTE
jgi:hypothetical protein